MSHTKYVMSGGLAFSEEKDMEKLQRLSLQGWHVRNFKFMGYTLEKGTSTDYIYSVDYRLLKKEEAEEYFDFFSSAGWTHIASQGEIHLFRALPGTKPIHSDRETVVEKHDNLGNSIKWLTISLDFLTVLLWIGALISTGTLHQTLTILAVILTVVAIPLTWTLITVYTNKWKAEGKKGLANLMKTLPILFLLLVAVIIWIVFDKRNNPILLFASMLIGAVTFQTAIWGLMALYHKFPKK